MSDGTGTGRFAVGLAIWILFVLVGWNLRVVGATGAASFVYASLVLGLICVLLPWVQASVAGRRAPLLRAWHDPTVRLDPASFSAIAVAAIALAALKPPVVWLSIQGGVHRWLSGLDWIRESLTVDMPPLKGIGALLLAHVISVVAEEALYRGYLQRYVFAGLRRPWAVLITSALYTVAYPGPLHTLFVPLVGIVLGAAVEITGRVWVGVLLHATANLVGILLGESGEWERLLCPWVWVAVPVLVGALAFLYHHLRRRDRVPAEGAST